MCKHPKIAGLKKGWVAHQAGSPEVEQLLSEGMVETRKWPEKVLKRTQVQLSYLV